MKSLDEKGVSEVVGAMLILAIVVLFLGILQLNEVPRWNKELEQEQFNIAYSDFLNLRSNLEEASTRNIPKTSSMHMGVRYPERFMLRNPGPGAVGTLTTYPLGINVSYILADGNFSYYNYTSNGIVYELDGYSTFPKLVYENGIIIRDFGKANITDDQQRLLVNNQIFVPFVYWNSISMSSVDTESLNIKPYNPVIANITNMNITMETKYPKVWNDLLKNTQANVSGNKITINFSSPAQSILLPPAVTAIDSIYTGSIQVNTGTWFSSSPLTVPPFSNTDPSKPNWPVITNIQIRASTSANSTFQKTHSNITATVKNVTGPAYIYADLTGLTRDVDPLEYKVRPDQFFPNNWSMPNSNVVTWSQVGHVDYSDNYVVSISLWVINPMNNMQYYTERTFVRKTNDWQSQT